VAILDASRSLAAAPPQKDDCSEDAVALLEHPVQRKTSRSRTTLERPTIDRTGWQPSELRRVVVRLADGEIVQLGTAPNRESAMTLARSVIAELRQPTGTWPLITSRVVHPEAVVSVDVLRI